MFWKMPLIQLKIWKSYFYFALILSLYPMVSGFPKETNSLDSKVESKFKEGIFDYQETRGDLIENAGCKCDNGKCVREGAKIVCQCPPEYGKFSPSICKACECGKGFNCTFVVGFWSTEKNCICPYGQERNQPCKNIDACASKPCKHYGKCSVEGSSFKCKCEFPWTGRTCEEDSNFLTSDTTVHFSTTSPVIEYTRNISFETTYEPSNLTETTMSSHEPSKDYNATVEPSEFTLDFNVTSEDFDNFTNSNNQTFEPWNTTVDYSTTEESSNHTRYFTTIELPFNETADFNQTSETPLDFTVDYNKTTEVFDNFTNSNNQTFEPWNATVEYSTTEESSNHTRYFTTVELPFNETSDFNQTSEMPSNFTVDYNKTTDFEDNWNTTTVLPTETTSVDGLSTSVTASTSKPVIYIFRNVYTIQNLTELVIKT